MEMLHRVDRFERMPVLEPRNSVGIHMRAESLLDPIVDIATAFRKQVANVIVHNLEFELRPNHKVHNSLIDAVRPVIEENPDVICRDSWYQPREIVGRVVGSYLGW